MDLEVAFLKAAFPDPVIICRLPLVDYTLGHELLLRRLGSPFLADARHTDLELIPHLFTNLFICSLPWREARAAADSPDLPKQFKKWQKILGRFDAHEAIARFLLYIRAGSHAPPFARTKRRGYSTINPGAPFHLVLLTSLLTTFHMELFEALSLPFGLANWLYATHWELQGSIKLRTDTPKHVKEALEKLGLRRLTADDFAQN